MVSTRRSRLQLSDEQREALLEIYEHWGISIDEYARRPRDLAALTERWARVVGRTRLPRREWVLQFMGTERKCGRWVRLGRRAVDPRQKFFEFPDGLPPRPVRHPDELRLPELAEPLKRVLSAVYADLVVESGLSSDAAAYDRGLQRRIAREFECRTKGVRIEPHVVAGLLIRMRKQGRLRVRDSAVLLTASFTRTRLATGQLSLPFREDADDLTAVPWDRRAGMDQFDLGLEAEHEGDDNEAVRRYQQSLLEEELSPQTCLNLGNCLYRLRRYDAAATRYRQSVEIDPGFASGWANLGTALLRVPNSIDEAVDAFEQAIALDPVASASAHFNCGQVLHVQGRIEEAVEHWRAYLALDADGDFGEIARAKLQQFAAAANEAT